MKDFTKRIENVPRNRRAGTVEKMRKLVLDMWDAGYNCTEIARAIGRDHTTVLHHLWKQGIDPTERSKRNRLLREAQNSNMKARKIKEQESALKRYRIEATKELAVQEIRNKRLDEDREVAFKLWKEGKSYVYMSKLLGISASRLQGLLKYVPEYNEIKGTRSVNSQTPVRQLTMDRKLIKEWVSISEAARSIGIPRGGITDVCKNRVPSLGGYKWAYVKK